MSHGAAPGVEFDCVTARSRLSSVTLGYQDSLDPIFPKSPPGGAGVSGDVSSGSTEQISLTRTGVLKDLENQRKNYVGAAPRRADSSNDVHAWDDSDVHLRSERPVPVAFTMRTSGSGVFDSSPGESPAPSEDSSSPSVDHGMKSPESTRSRQSRAGKSPGEKRDLSLSRIGEDFAAGAAGYDPDALDGFTR